MSHQDSHRQHIEECIRIIFRHTMVSTQSKHYVNLTMRLGLILIGE